MTAFRAVLPRAPPHRAPSALRPTCPTSSTDNHGPKFTLGARHTLAFFVCADAIAAAASAGLT
eukprot:scaffold9007_cov112-Isochrysis_galbana.AAC.6